MTRTDFISQLDELRRRGRSLFLVGGPFALLLEMAVIVYVFRRFPPHVPYREALGWYLAAVIVCGTIVAGFGWLVQRVTPICMFLRAPAVAPLQHCVSVISFSLKISAPARCGVLP